MNPYSQPAKKKEEEPQEEEEKETKATRKPVDPTMITVTIGSFQTTLPINEIGFDAAKSFLDSLKPHFLQEKRSPQQITL